MGLQFYQTVALVYSLFKTVSNELLRMLVNDAGDKPLSVESHVKVF